MKRLKGFVGFMYRHRFIRYVFVGGTTFLLDIGLLIFCHEVLGFSIELSTTVSYWSSILYNFSLNRWWTFSASEERAIHEHAFLYGGLLAFNYLFTLTFVSVMSNFMFYGLAKVLATGIQISWTYPLYKFVIFKRSAS